MCGIFGFDRTNENTRRMIPLLAVAMELRGDDSWGVTDGHVLFKHPHGILQSYVDHGDLESPTYHTRGASVGAVSERNAHPFEYVSLDNAKVVVGVHNGHINNHSELKKKYEAQRKDFEVDSENIFAHLAEGLPLKEIEGYGAVVWYEYPFGKPEERVQYISCFQNPAMHVAKLKSGEIVFASTDTAIKTAVRLAGLTIDTFYEIKQHQKYRVALGEIYDEGEFKWGPSYSYHNSGQQDDWRRHTSTGNTNTTRNNSVADNRTGSNLHKKVGEQCLFRGCFRNTNGNIICAPCLDDLYKDIVGDEKKQGDKALVVVK